MSHFVTGHDQGRELEKLFHFVRKQGIITSLDLAKPDPQSEGGRVDWRRILERALPFVDIFQPSADELLYMLDRNMFDSLKQKHGESFVGFISTTLLDKLADTLLKMGSNIVAIKLGDQGLYLRTRKNIQHLSNRSYPSAHFKAWSDRQLLVPCFQTNVVGTTGAGDCTVAGFVTGVISGLDRIDALKLAVGVGACSTEKLDATSGVPSLDIVINRISSGWKCRETQIENIGWKWLKDHSIWQGPQDAMPK
jgi:sugar/nucleoside kinase (ribokinase family)